MLSQNGVFSMRKAVKSLFVLGLCSALHLRADYYVAQRPRARMALCDFEHGGQQYPDAVNAATNGRPGLGTCR